MDLRQARIAAGLTLREAGQRLGLFPQAIHDWEMESRLPRLETLLKVSQVYGVPVDQLERTPLRGPVSKRKKARKRSAKPKKQAYPKELIETLGKLLYGREDGDQMET